MKSVTSCYTHRKEARKSIDWEVPPFDEFVQPTLLEISTISNLSNWPTPVLGIHRGKIESNHINIGTSHLFLSGLTLRYKTRGRQVCGFFVCPVSREPVCRREPEPQLNVSRDRLASASL